MLSLPLITYDTYIFNYKTICHHNIYVYNWNTTHLYDTHFNNEH